MRPLSPREVLEYVDAGGRSQFKLWFDRLDASVASRVVAALARLEQGSWLHVKSVGRGVHELRIDCGPGYRVYFGTESASIVVLLGGGAKTGQQRDIARAQSSWLDYRRRRH
jgi:putative addiction module killer protein